MFPPPLQHNQLTTLPPALSEETAKERFGPSLFTPSTRDKHTTAYASSTPYKHGVIHNLINDTLLRSVRDEVRQNVSFTPKETDIYKIHQSGDLANLDGLDDDALSKLPSLLALRDAMYSETFRSYVSHITGCGPLSGRKTDMAINVYTPGCYLLCHDDVIGSRKVSYILYLVDPDIPWQSEWGGALRLYPVTKQKGEKGEVANIVAAEPTKVIPPAWNQLSFFAVQPGESFHDVEEVYHAETKEELEKQGGRIRMAISGWFHIPQVGEEGYVEGAEEEQVANSGLMQLQGNPDQHDLPSPQVVPVSKDEDSQESQGFDEDDLEFLLKYMAPTYLTPDTLERMAEYFEENSSITVSDFLHPRFAAKLREYVEGQEAAKDAGKTTWKLARPPHKHRFAYLQADDKFKKGTPLEELLNVFLPSKAFRTWLEMATGSTIEAHHLVARRFRRGQDYTLATGHDGKPRLELNLGLTPTLGWGDEVEGDDEDEDDEEEEDIANKKSTKPASGKTNGAGKGKGKAVEPEPKPKDQDEEAEEVGGHEVYMAGDDDGTEDAAIYKSNAEDDNILFFQAAAWNKLTIVMRDSGVLKFVKYVSRKANGDRWDVAATFEVEEEDEDGEDAETLLLGESEEEEFRGFSPSDDSDSD